jgi:hypothetical protein
MELDGVEHDPTPFQRADIYAGAPCSIGLEADIYFPLAQRISLILKANQSVDNYWVMCFHRLPTVAN